MSMACNQACPYNTLNGCKVNEYGAICPMSNMVFEEKPMTNADRIRAMTDEELADMRVRYNPETDMYTNDTGEAYYDFVSAMEAELEWLKQPAEGDV